jgi:hypothetical protein
LPCLNICVGLAYPLLLMLCLRFSFILIPFIPKMWSVPYFPHAIFPMFLMIRLYEFWQQEHLAPSEALRQAKIWVRDSSNAEKLAYLEQAIEDTELSQKAIKRFKREFDSKAERSFAHLYYWAAFTYTGL